MGAFIALSSLRCFGVYVAQDFISPRTGKSTIFWGDASKGKDAYVLEYDKDSNNYYFEKVEKNKPAAKKSVENKPAAKNLVEKKASENKQ